MYYQVERCALLFKRCQNKAQLKLTLLVQGVKYNIPVSLWLPERYPNVAPIMYVVPTPDMIIKPRHAFVDASGVVSSAYLRNWSQPHSTLMIMCNDVSIQFGQDPPLFSKPPGWVPPAPMQNHQQSPQRPPQQPSRAQSPANQHTDPHHHTFQAENPMIRYPALGHRLKLCSASLHSCCFMHAPPDHDMSVLVCERCMLPAVSILKTLFGCQRHIGP